MNEAAMAPRPPIFTVILFGPVWVTVAGALIGPALTVAAFGPAAGSAEIVTSCAPVALISEENVTSAVPEMWSIVALLKLELRCTPVAVALTLEMSILPAGMSLALMSIRPTSCESTWVRNGKPSIVTAGLLRRLSDDWILPAIMFCA